MDTKEMLTAVGLILNAVGLIFALVKFSQEQRKANQLKKSELEAAEARAMIAAKAEIRTEYKLRIFQYLLNDNLSYEDIVATFGRHAPTSNVDHIELRKCIYEMLVEETIFAHEDGTYTANTLDDVDESEDGDKESA